jgi:hypothetical protein
MKYFALVAFAAWLAVVFPAMHAARAANADQPYQNVNKANDAGNNTGNAQVDKLNSNQLDENQKAPPATK